MAALLLAPYNDSMRLGQGYNSFLQTPCLSNAVNISGAVLSGRSSAVILASDGSTVPSQTVSYSASFVDKMSEVVRSMNISAGSSIRSGSVQSSGAHSSVDEVKFQESDLNAVMSVKVINQTRTLSDNVQFNPLDVQLTDLSFHETYGDSFVSGFIEGGDLHGIVSIKVLDASRKSQIKSKIRGSLNGSNSEWSPESSGELASSLSESEVTITVNYSGGGSIKPPDTEWTLESLIAASSTFADKVAQCPQRTWAILTRYNTVPSFIEWQTRLHPMLKVRRYDGVQRYTSELLDTFTEFKTNLMILNDAIRHPDKYVPSDVKNAVQLELKDLLDDRKMVKKEMEKIVQKIEVLDQHPESVVGMIAQDDILAPELHRARLPMSKEKFLDKAVPEVMKLLEDLLPIVESAPKDPLKDLTDQQDRGTEKLRERERVTDEKLVEDLKSQLALSKSVEDETMARLVKEQQDRRADNDRLTKELTQEKADRKSETDQLSGELQKEKNRYQTDVDKLNADLKQEQSGRKADTEKGQTVLSQEQTNRKSDVDRLNGLLEQMKSGHQTDIANLQIDLDTTKKVLMDQLPPADWADLNRADPGVVRGDCESDKHEKHFRFVHPVFRQGNRAFEIAGTGESVLSPGSSRTFLTARPENGYSVHFYRDGGDWYLQYKTGYSMYATDDDHLYGGQGNEIPDRAGKWIITKTARGYVFISRYSGNRVIGLNEKGELKMMPVYSTPSVYWIWQLVPQ